MYALQVLRSYRLLACMLVVLLLFRFNAAPPVYSLATPDTTITRRKMIASLTTSPLRLPLLGITLTSLMHQNRPPDGILVNLPTIFKRTNELYNIPTSLRQQFPTVEFFECGDDEGPATKLIGALRRYGAAEDVWIVTVDDDVAYPPCAFEMLEDAIARWGTTLERHLPLSAVGMSGFMVPNWGHGLKRVANRTVDVLEGYGGAAYHRSMFHEWDAYWPRVKHDRATFMSDDLVISNFLALKGVQRRSLAYPQCNIKHFWEGRRSILPQGQQRDSLSRGAGNGSFHFQARYPVSAKFLIGEGLWGLPSFLKPEGD